MITYKKACTIAGNVRDKECPSCKHAHVVDIKDRWAFTFSVYAPNDARYMTPAPSFFIFKEDGRVEWFSIPPLENLDLIESGHAVKFIQ